MTTTDSIPQTVSVIPGGPQIQVRDQQWYGWVPEASDHRDIRLNTRKAASFRGRRLPPKLPAKSRIRESGFLPPVKNQDALGSCTGNAWAVAVEYEYNRMAKSEMAYADMEHVPVSRLQIYYNERVMEGSVDWDSGAWIRDGIKSIAKLGVAPETYWPYNINRFAEKPPQSAYDEALRHQALAYGYVDNNGVQYHIKEALIAGTIVIMGFSVYPAYENVGPDGVMKTPKPGDPLLGGHATAIVDYEKLPISRKVYLTTQGSWDTSFGDHGFVHMEANWVCARNEWNASDMWAIQSMEGVQ